MTTDQSTLEKSIYSLLSELHIERAHFAGRIARDWRSFLTVYPESVASLTLVCPRPLDTQLLQKLGSKLLLIRGEHGRDSDTLKQDFENLSEARRIVLPDYNPNNSSDILYDRSDDVYEGLISFLKQIDQTNDIRPISLDQTEGQFDGLLYSIKGSGPPLILLPLYYSPSQWDPIIDQLSKNYCTITINGSKVGSVASLESRALGGYLDVVTRVIEKLKVIPGERVLDVGCGPGSLDRWLAHRTDKLNPIVGVDPSPFLLREASAMAKAEGLEEVVQFQEAGGDSLPFPDNSFDISISFTAIQFVNADQMIREMRRVTKPGGRVGVLARGDDRPNLINVSVESNIRSKIEGVRNVLANPLGCNDASLYRRFHEGGLIDVNRFPQLAIFTLQSDSLRLNDMQDRFNPILSDCELATFREAYSHAVTDGSFFIAEWFHCAVGTNPS